MDYQMKREGHENKSHTMSSGPNHSRTFDEAYTPQPIFCPPPSQETGMLCLSRAFLIGCATTDPFLRILRPCTALRSREEWKLFSLLLSVPGNSTALIMVRRNLKGCSRCLGKQPTLHSPYQILKAQRGSVSEVYTARLPLTTLPHPLLPHFTCSVAYSSTTGTWDGDRQWQLEGGMRKAAS